ncbi:MAG: hypothetical protein EAX90_10575 [Candidatus Heimdallarchaeota archaeon]|nr:hypothetical protein [Candidatus Heimdallarchaeota archaeon]
MRIGVRDTDSKLRLKKKYETNRNVKLTNKIVRFVENICITPVKKRIHIMEILMLIGASFVKAYVFCGEFVKFARKYIGKGGMRLNVIIIKFAIVLLGPKGITYSKERGIKAILARERYERIYVIVIRLKSLVKNLLGFFSFKPEIKSITIQAEINNDGITRNQPHIEVIPIDVSRVIGL